MRRNPIDSPKPVTDSLKPTTIDAPHLLRIPEAAAKLAVCPRTVQSAIARGDLRVVRLGRAVRIDPADLRAYIWTCRSAAPGGGR